MTATFKQEIEQGICPYCGEPFSVEQIEKVGKRIQTCGSPGCQKEHEITRNKNKEESRRNKYGVYISPGANRSNLTKQHDKRKQWNKDNPRAQVIGVKGVGIKDGMAIGAAEGAGPAADARVYV